MNGRKAKQLRNAARQNTVGQPDLRYEIATGKKRVQFKGETVEVQTRQLVLGPCTRRLNKAMKRFYKTGTIRSAQA